MWCVGVKVKCKKKIPKGMRIKIHFFTARYRFESSNLNLTSNILTMKIPKVKKKKKIVDWIHSILFISILFLYSITIFSMGRK